MRSKKVWRYYCDHCNKGGCGKAAMAKHEQSCIKNPNRKCRMCALGQLSPLPLAELAEHIGNIDDLRRAADGCPACMLAAAVQFIPKQDDWDGSYERTPPERFAYVDFAEEKRRFWINVRESDAEQRPNYGPIY